MQQQATDSEQLPLSAGKTKRCHRCKEDKTLDAFALCRSRGDGFQNRCRACQALAHQEWKQRHPDGVAVKNARTRKHYRDNPKYYAEKRREFEERNPTYKRDYYLANRERFLESRRRRTIQEKYGLSVPEYEAILACGCAICGATFDGARLNLDHDHSTGKLRDALCANCNRGLGYFKDDPKWLRTAADYLERHRK